MSGFKKAQRTAKKIKASIQGASGSGKTYSALKIATALVARTAPGKRIALIDTEESAELYSPPFDFDVDGDFGEGTKRSYPVDKLVEKLENARKDGGYGAVIVDSATHFWKEAGGMLSMIDAICAAQRAKGQKGDSFAAWKTVDPVYRKFMSYLRTYPIHVILCIRAKQSYEKVEGANGKGSIKKVGVEPEFRDGFEFEMDAQFAIDENHVMVPLKHRLGEFLDGKTFRNPGDDVAEIIEEWLGAGAPGQEDEVVAPAAPPPEVAAAPKQATNVRRDTMPVKAADPEDAKDQARVDAVVAAMDPATIAQTIAQTISAKMAVAATPAELALLTKEAGVAKKEGPISPDEYKAMTKVWSTADQRLKAAAAAALAALTVEEAAQ